MKRRHVLVAVAVLLLIIFLGASLAQAGWVRRYNGSANEYDFAYGIASDPVGGGVVVTGYSTIKVMYYAWRCYQTIKYDAAGNVKWKRGYSAGANQAQAYAVAVDQAGNVYVTGESSNGANDDFLTIKYDAAGNAAWVKRYNGPANDVDSAAAIAVDQAGNVYVAGDSIGAGSNWDYLTIKYDAAGKQQWTRRYDGPGNGVETVTGIAVDQAGNVYVTGSSIGTDNAMEYATLKYDTAGNLKWVKRYSGPGKGYNAASAIALDQAGNVYVTGVSSNGANDDFVTIKYGAAGSLIWAKRYNGPANGIDGGTAIALDQWGNVHVTGYSTGFGTGWDYLTIKYNPAGAVLWTRRYDGPAKADDGANAIAVDQAGNVYVTGASRGVNTGLADYATVKYDVNGDLIWVNRYNNSVLGEDTATGIALDNSGGVYVTGYSQAIGTQFDFCTIKYGP